MKGCLGILALFVIVTWVLVQLDKVGVEIGTFLIVAVLILVALVNWGKGAVGLIILVVLGVFSLVVHNLAESGETDVNALLGLVIVIVMAAYMIYQLFFSK